MISSKKHLWQLLVVFAFMGYSWGAAIYVDNKLEKPCKGTYSIAKRDNGGSDGNAYPTPQEAADVSKPGDTIYFRKGFYRNTVDTKAKVPVLQILTSGTVKEPIVYKSYKNEEVTLSGCDNSGTARKYYSISISTPPSDQLDSSGAGVQNITIDGLIVEGAVHYGLGVFGPASKIKPIFYPTKNIIIRHVVARNNSGANNRGVGIRTEGKIINVLIDKCEAYNNTGGGISFGRISKSWHDEEPDTIMSAASYSTIRNCLIYRNAHPDYPGNTDGMGGSNMYRCFFENNIVYDNSDDGIDIYSSFEIVLAGNIVFGHQYDDGNNVGAKFSAGGGGRHLLYRNVVFNNRSYSFEGSSPKNPLRGYYPSKFYNNIACNGSRGFNISGDFRSNFNGYEQMEFKNNVALNNGTDFSGVNGKNSECDYNFISDKVVLKEHQEDGNDRHSISYSLSIPEDITIDTVFQPGWTIEQKLNHIRGQVVKIFSPVDGSKLVDAGTKIEDADCFNYVNGSDKIISEWHGENPDIGAFELGALDSFQIVPVQKLQRFKNSVGSPMHVVVRRGGTVCFSGLDNSYPVGLTIYAISGQKISEYTVMPSYSSVPITELFGYSAPAGRYVFNIVQNSRCSNQVLNLIR